jgi:adenylate cyclase
LSAARAPGTLLGPALTWFGLSNLAGAVVVFVYQTFVVDPVGPGVTGLDEWATVGVFVGYMLLVLPVGGTLGWRVLAPTRSWLTEHRRPSDDELRNTLTAAWRLALVSLAGWAGAMVLFSSLSLAFGEGGIVALRLFATIAVGALATCFLAYLLVDRSLRPVYARALAGGPPPRALNLGVHSRLMLSWWLGSGIPLLGIALAPVGRRLEPLSPTALAWLGAIGVVSGSLMMGVAARSVGDRLERVRWALREVGDGDIGVRLTVDDGGDVGFLQAGFNDMVEGMRERQRLHDLFGRHVGEEVARRALDRGIGLGGEQREVSALFVDLIGSTALAENRSPHEVVETLNALFGAVVDAVAAEGGWVNKFDGDGALCVFGAPGDQPDHAARALRAACGLRARLRTAAGDVPALDAGIGVSSGRVVAGNVGAENRYEYTVVGDPVNEAARLTDLAKRRPGRLLVSGRTVAAAGAEARSWVPAGEVTLRGRVEPTTTFEPAG